MLPMNLLLCCPTFLIWLNSLRETPEKKKSLQGKTRVNFNIEIAVWLQKYCRHTQECVLKTKVQTNQWSYAGKQRVGGRVTSYNIWHVLSAHSSHRIGWEAPTEISWQTVVPTKTTVTFNKNSCHGCQSKLVKIVHFQATRTKTLGGLKSLFKRVSMRAKRNVSLIYVNTDSCKR